MRTNVNTTKPSMPSPISWHKSGRSGSFICVPVEVLQDRDLKHETLRVLLAVAKHADEAGECFPGRKRLAEMTGIHPTNISNATSKLAKLGWLTKIYGKRRSVTYRLSVPTKLNGHMPREEPIDGLADLEEYLRAHIDNSVPSAHTARGINDLAAA